LNTTGIEYRPCGKLEIMKEEWTCLFKDIYLEENGENPQGNLSFSLHSNKIRVYLKKYVSDALPLSQPIEWQNDLEWN
jgi:hypothetical protein